MHNPCIFAFVLLSWEKAHQMGSVLLMIKKVPILLNGMCCTDNYDSLMHFVQTCDVIS